MFVDPDHSVAKPDLYVVNLDHAVAETDPSFGDPDHSVADRDHFVVDPVPSQNNVNINQGKANKI